MQNIILIAPPAAGKGTYAKLIEETYHLPHISTGDLLRKESTKDTPTSRHLKEIMSAGRLVSDDIITSILSDRLKQDDCQNGYILDGYPRNIEQAKAYEEMLGTLNKDLGIVIYIDIDEQDAKERVLGRVVCPQCGASFNTIIKAFSPKENNHCNYCKHELVSRVDDTEETFHKRFCEYLEKTDSLVKYYQDKGILKVVKSQNDDTTEIMLERIKKMVSND